MLATTGLVAPLVGRDGKNTGLVVVAGKRDGEFSDDDEALLVQLAQMTATAVENTLFAEARESNRIKDEFLATLSHELRTPLSSILGWAQLLRTQMLDADETQEALEIIERNAEIQTSLIEELLDISRIITGKMQLHFRPISLGQVVQAAVNIVRPAAQARQVNIDLAIDPQADSLHGDADRLQQVFWNLLSNAVKFTPPGGHIDVTLEAADSQCRVVVADNGEGIAPEFLPHVFDRFRQADSTTSRKHGGLGIGLAIVQHVVELHGGTVHAESAGKGRGTTIVVSLPADHSHAGPAPDSRGMDRELHESVAGPDSQPARALG
jgi:signal transduction histidine kinase